MPPQLSRLLNSRGFERTVSMTEIVKSYNTEKGYGFIQPLIGKPNETSKVFFHISSVIGIGSKAGISPRRGGSL
jgi:hypothetical protein